MKKQTIELIQKEYNRCQKPWILGFSGGKDSTALLTLLYNSLYEIKKPRKPVKVVYCDTGVEIPIFSELVHKTFSSLEKESNENKIPITTIIVKPRLEDRYFSKVIGRGYATPSNKFRWCTDRLRIRPLSGVIDKNSEKYTVLLGVRKGESNERDSIINHHSTEDKYYLRQSNNSKAKIFSPIIEYRVNDIWKTIVDSELPRSIYKEELKLYYEYVGDKNNTIQEQLNGKGRFGCWTCTVVRNDKAVKSLIDNGFSELVPLYDYRNWLMEIRDNPDYRCSQRRNGVKGLGPFTLTARKEMLQRLLEAQKRTKYTLIEEDEIRYIKYLWELDAEDRHYVE